MLVINIAEVSCFMNEDIKQDVLPNEEYTFKFKEDEIDKIKKSLLKITLSRVIYILVLNIVLILMSILSVRYVSGIVIGVLIMFVAYHIQNIIQFNKSWNNSKVWVCNSIYRYKLFDEYVFVDVCCNDERVKTSKIYYKDIIKISKADKYILFQTATELYIARCSDLNKDSHLFACMRKFEYNKKAPKIKRKK